MVITETGDDRAKVQRLQGHLTKTQKRKKKKKGFQFFFFFFCVEMKIDKQVAIVTGAASGLGEAAGT